MPVISQAFKVLVDCIDCHISLVTMMTFDIFPYLMTNLEVIYKLKFDSVLFVCFLYLLLILHLVIHEY